MGVGQFGASAEVATFQGFYSTDNAQRDANDWVARAQWGCNVSLQPSSTTVLQVTLTSGPQFANEGGIDDANYLILVQQFGRAAVSVAVTYGYTTGGGSGPDVTNLIELTFGTAFTSDDHLVCGTVYQTVPSINEVTGSYNPGGNP